MKRPFFSVASLSLLLLVPGMRAEIKVVTERNSSERASARFKFNNVPSPAKGDAAASAKFSILDGERDRNGGELSVLHDGRLPNEEDQPSANFFFRAGSDGGRLLIDLGKPIEVRQVNTYSWHGGSRGPQVYQLYASDGLGEGFNSEPKKGTDLDKGGWKLIAKVDSRPKEGDTGGQHGASISDSSGPLGKYRYLLFDISHTEDSDAFGNTFYSEIDVVDRDAPEVAEAVTTQRIEKQFATEDGKYHFTFDTTVAPDLTEWTYSQLSPVVLAWYPKLVAMLPSEGYFAPTNVTILFRENMGGTPASAGGSRINCNVDWFRKNLKGEARGSVVHEMVHVVQQYGWGRRRDPDAPRTRTPGWLTEGIPDYLRWFKYEPETHGAEISKRGLARAKYDASYRVTGNFLNWVTTKYDTNIVVKLNTAARQGKYNEEIWKTATGKTVQELGDEWKKELEEKLSPGTAAAEAKEKTDETKKQ